MIATNLSVEWSSPIHQAGQRSAQRSGTNRNAQICLPAPQRLRITHSTPSRVFVPERRSSKRADASRANLPPLRKPALLPSDREIAFFLQPGFDADEGTRIVLPLVVGQDLNWD